MSNNIDWKESIERAQFLINLTSSQVTAIMCLESLFVAGLLQSTVFSQIDSSYITKGVAEDFKDNERLKEVTAGRRVDFVNRSSSQHRIAVWVFKKADNTWEYYQAVIYSSKDGDRTSVNVYAYANDLWTKDEKSSS